MYFRSVLSLLAAALMPSMSDAIDSARVGVSMSNMDWDDSDVHSGDHPNFPRKAEDNLAATSGNQTELQDQLWKRIGQTAYDAVEKALERFEKALNIAPAVAPAAQAESGRREVFLPPSQQNEIFMRYMPARQMVVCSCAKCGSTSMYEYLFEQEFSEAWSACLHKDNTSTCREDVARGPQNIMSSRWQGAFNMVQTKVQQAALMKKAFSFALVRDPKERLISAWKSKVSCNKTFGVDLYDRAHFDEHENRYLGFVPALLRLEGKEDNVTCLPMNAFLRSLRSIHEQGKTKYLDRHFLPQHLGCFYRFPPEKWSKVVAISEPGAFASLARHVESDIKTPPQAHLSLRDVDTSEETEELLNEVTREEYEVLAPYLQQQAS
eukprot:CAMPEP_0170597236 /NCGR_PEP_ID=MMETSP0224-20130122/15603_1 /TAXON_ID=285029 /ORGANISM="Togula jolla, Strain CCCM 725" /LENGTH=378 /DNA_ID=CAMNT_0010921701 /DNA_START=83 /DNA_END=1219 /DNA_ORIENTATION=-